MEQQEEQQVRQAQAGDRQAFAGLVERYWGRVYRFLFALSRNVHQAEDLTQDVFLKAWHALPGFHSAQSFRAWLFQIARNGLIDSRRGPRSAPTEQVTDTAAVKEPGPVTRVLLQEATTLLEQACDRLPAGFRVPLLLWTQEDLSYAEIAQVRGVTEETARWRVFKARQFLLKEIGPHWTKKKKP